MWQQGHSSALYVASRPEASGTGGASRVAISALSRKAPGLSECLAILHEFLEGRKRWSLTSTPCGLPALPPPQAPRSPLHRPPQRVPGTPMEHAELNRRL